MNKKIAILRGINVGGKRKIPMADLRSLCENLGWKDVKTYIQSGNIIFTSDRPNSELEEILESTLKKIYDFQIPVIVRSSNELLTTIRKNPFLTENKSTKQLHLTFLKEKPSKEKAELFMSIDFHPDDLKIEDKDVFICCTGKYHQSKLTNNFIEKRLGTAATTRNWETVVKLSEMIIQKNRQS